MTITLTQLTAPTILVTGTRIHVNGATGREVLPRTDYTSTAIADNVTGSDSSQSWTNSGPIYMLAPFTFTITTAYPQANWTGTINALSIPYDNGDHDLVINTPTNHIVLGGDSNLASTRPSHAELVFTVNGKDPRRTKGKIYRTAQHVHNNTGSSSSDNIIIKARVYYAGQWSTTRTVEFIVVGDPNTRTIYYQ